MEAVQVAFGSTGGDITPIRTQILLAHTGQLETLMYHFTLDVVGVGSPEFALHERVTHVVDMYGKEAVQSREVHRKALVHLISGYPST
mmetsp:Transcript_6872/g.41915  ORF Transcript_6872/g.41915 Transcript_6872/m.41915 type:complete len:88 (-) Transcript_6872:174-437(-)